MILAIDPGKRAGWAIVDGEQVLEAGVIRCDREISDPQETVQNARVLYHITRVMIEKQRPGPMGAESLERMAYHRHLWEIAARMKRLDIETVWPATWQSHFGLTADRAGPEEKELRSIAKHFVDEKVARKYVRFANQMRKKRQDSHKAAIVRLATSLASPYGFIRVEQDMADAILIGLWAERRAT